MTEPCIYLVSETDNGAGAYAIITLDLSTARWLLSLMDAMRPLAATYSNGFSQSEFNYTVPDYYHQWQPVAPQESAADAFEDTYPEEEEAINSGEWVRMPAGYRPPGEDRILPVYTTLAVDAESVSFLLYSAEGGSRVATNELEREWLEELERELQAMTNIPIGPVIVRRDRLIT